MKKHILFSKFKFSIFQNSNFKRLYKQNILIHYRISVRYNRYSIFYLFILKLGIDY